MCVKCHVRYCVYNNKLNRQDPFSHKAFRLMWEIDNKIITELNVCIM